VELHDPRSLAKEHGEHSGREWVQGAAVADTPRRGQPPYEGYDIVRCRTDRLVHDEDPVEAIPERPVRHV